MTLRTQRLLISLGVVIIAGLLAFPLRDAIYAMVIVPVAFITWNLNLIYRSLSQGLWWWIVIFVIVFMLASSLFPQPSFPSRVVTKRKPALGQVEALAVWLRKAERGVYFKWLIANRLGKLAYQMLVQRDHGRPRSVFAPLLGTDWEPSKELQMYLEAGLHGSFADFPYTERSSKERIPLDHNVLQAVEFLEEQVENGHPKPRHPGQV
jgi:hypothetical protein